MPSILDPPERRRFVSIDLPLQISNVAFQTGSISLDFPWRDLKNPSGIAESLNHTVFRISADFSPELIQRIINLLSLKDGWDGKGSKAINPAVIADAVDLIRRLSSRTDYKEPFIAPTFEGFVQIEWSSRNRLLDYEADENGWSIAGTDIEPGNRRDYYNEECGRKDFDALEKFYAWFAGVEMLWPL